MSENKVCPECGGAILGRSDKKFCCDECRVAFNNRIYRDRRREVSFINRALMKNFTVLKDFFDRGEYPVPAARLTRQGFDFDYITSIQGQAGEHSSLWVCCYTLAYTMDESGNVIIRDRASVM